MIVKKNQYTKLQSNKQSKKTVHKHWLIEHAHMNTKKINDNININQDEKINDTNTNSNTYTNANNNINTNTIMPFNLANSANPSNYIPYNYYSNSLNNDASKTNELLTLLKKLLEIKTMMNINTYVNTYVNMNLNINTYPNVNPNIYTNPNTYTNVNPNMNTNVYTNTYSYSNTNSYSNINANPNIYTNMNPNIVTNTNSKIMNNNDELVGIKDDISNVNPNIVTNTNNEIMDDDELVSISDDDDTNSNPNTNNNNEIIDLVVDEYEKKYNQNSLRKIISNINMNELLEIIKKKKLLEPYIDSEDENYDYNLKYLERRKNNTNSNITIIPHYDGYVLFVHRFSDNEIKMEPLKKIKAIVNPNIKKSRIQIEKNKHIEISDLNTYSFSLKFLTRKINGINNCIGVIISRKFKNKNYLEKNVKMYVEQNKFTHVKDVFFDEIVRMFME